MPILYHFWSSPQAQRVRLALRYKRIDYYDRPLAYHDDETFFELGISRQVPVLQLDDATLLTDSLDILRRIDELFPDGPRLVDRRIDDAAWAALIDWRNRCDSVLERLYGPVRPAYFGIGDDEAALKAYKAEIRRHFGMTLEELANDRYDGFAQLDRLTRLHALAQHLAQKRFYTGQVSIADMVLCADLSPLQTLDGISLPIDLMYYLGRVAEICGVDLEEGLLAH